MDIDRHLQEAVQSFWTGQDAQAGRQKEAGKVDAGIRGAVTGGQHMGALETLVVDVLIAAGLTELDIKVKSKLELPGYYRAEKKWDLLVISKGHLVAAIEFKSQAGESIGNNINNRSEEAIGTATDLWVAFREGRFQDSRAPFPGYFFCWRISRKSVVPWVIKSRTSRSIPSSKVPHTLTDTRSFASGLCSSAFTRRFASRSPQDQLLRDRRLMFLTLHRTYHSGGL